MLPTLVSRIYSGIYPFIFIMHFNYMYCEQYGKYNSPHYIRITGFMESFFVS
jgi:hypothetical protein